VCVSRGKNVAVKDASGGGHSSQLRLRPMRFSEKEDCHAQETCRSDCARTATDGTRRMSVVRVMRSRIESYDMPGYFLEGDSHD